MDLGVRRVVVVPVVALFDRPVRIDHRPDLDVEP